MKTKVSLFYVALACVILGCDKKPAPPPASAELTTTQQASVQSPAIKPPAPDAAATTKKPAKSEVLGLDAMLKRIPTNEFTLSEKEGWDKFTMPKVQRWARENLYGKRGRIDVFMLKCNVAQEDANSKPDEWTVSLQVAGIHANYAGMGNRILALDKEDDTDHDLINPIIGTWGKASFAFRCTEAEARKWDAHDKTPLPAVTVEGDIVGIRFQPRLVFTYSSDRLQVDFFIGYDTFVQLDNIVTTRSTNTEPAALYLPELVMTLHGTLREPEEAITEIRRLDKNGDYQLLFVKYWNSRFQDSDGTKSSRFMTNLLSFLLVKDFDETKVKFTPCGDPPTEPQIAEAKAAVPWPKN